MSKKRILVFGLNGLIGWHLFQFARPDFECFGTYRRRLAEFKSPEFFRVSMHDQAQLERLVKKVDPHYVIHAWSMCDLDICESLPELARKVNVSGTDTILKSLRQAKRLEKILYISTDHVFSGQAGPYHEENDPEPMHVYGQTKIAAEEAVSSSGLPYLIVRPGLVIGDSVQGNKGPQDFLLSRLEAGKPVTYFEDEWRTPIRALSFAEECFNLLTSDQQGIFHVTGSQCFSRYELALKLAHENGTDTSGIIRGSRDNDRWAHIRPENISLISIKLTEKEDFK